jgi:RNA polymerase sigma factor (sigma-70 family)
MAISTSESTERLYREAFPMVCKAVARLGGDLDAAKDIFHDALIVYLEKDRDPAFQIKISAAAYVTGIARILWIRKFKNESRTIGLDDLDLQLELGHQVLPAEDTLQAKLLSHLISTGKKCLELLQAFYYEQRSMQEIAEQFHYKTRHSATVQKHKCIEKMRSEIKKSDYEKAVA